jgi:hypothetical protein
MKARLLCCCAAIFLMGCISMAHKDETLNPQAPADLVDGLGKIVDFDLSA